MRLIKFRAYLKGLPMEYFGLRNGWPANWTGWKTVMQYTGLKDKNGKDIFEGDILEWKHPKEKVPETYKVFFKDGAFRTVWLGDGRDEEIFDDAENMKVLGNIFENPDLLK